MRFIFVNKDINIVIIIILYTFSKLSRDMEDIRII